MFWSTAGCTNGLYMLLYRRILIQNNHATLDHTHDLILHTLSNEFFIVIPHIFPGGKRSVSVHSEIIVMALAVTVLFSLEWISLSLEVAGLFSWSYHRAERWAYLRVTFYLRELFLPTCYLCLQAYIV